MKPTISVVIPCYNASLYLESALDSVLHQTYPVLEVIVVDDGSSDDSLAIAQSFGGVVRVIKQSNYGECVARNRGIENAAGEWIAFLDADDIWEPGKLEMQISEIKNSSDVICVHSGYYLFGEKNEIPKSPKDVLNGSYEIETLLLNPLINTSTAIVKAGLPCRFIPGLKHGGDMIYFTELSLHGRFIYVPKTLAGYRMHKTQITKRDPNSWVEHFQNRFKWLAQNTNKLGSDRAANLEHLLLQQIVEWIQLAKWNRQWDRYWSLRKYCETLDWHGEIPLVLKEHLYPQSIYKLKDFADAIFFIKKNRKDS